MFTPPPLFPVLWRLSAGRGKILTSARKTNLSINKSIQIIY
jgi:hypothetical protein